MKKKIERIVGELKDRISGKYIIKEMRVFGSSARGDRKPESDIDIFVHLAHVNRQIEEDLFDMAYDLELKHDCLIDIIVVDDRGLSGVRGTAPIYENIRAEGAVV
ncbi:MAG: nucleotidyltransferase domain-containing protein [Syntrophales bacterium]